MSVREMNKSLWSDHNLKVIITKWKDSSVEDIASELGLTVENVLYVVSHLRARGLSAYLPKKSRVRKSEIAVVIENVAAALGLVVDKEGS